MASIAGSSIIEQLQWRYATKKFDPSKKISAADWSILEHSLILAPSSFGLQPLKFIVVNDAATRKKLREAAWNQSQVTDASQFVVFATRKSITLADIERYVNRIAHVRKVPVGSLDEYKGMMAGFIKNPDLNVHQWTARQAYIALGQLISTASMMGIDSCPMEGFGPAQFDEILGLAKHDLAAVVACAVGYRAADDKSASHAKVRFEHSDLIVHV